MTRRVDKYEERRKRLETICIRSHEGEHGGVLCTTRRQRGSTKTETRWPRRAPLSSARLPKANKLLLRIRGPHRLRSAAHLISSRSLVLLRRLHKWHVRLKLAFHLSLSPSIPGDILQNSLARINASETFVIAWQLGHPLSTSRVLANSRILRVIFPFYDHSKVPSIRDRLSRIAIN